MEPLERVLLVEDSPTDALIVKHALKGSYRVEHVRTPEDAQERLLRDEYEVVVTDYYLRGATGLELQRWISDRRIDVSVIVMSGRGDERVAAEALKFGAYDYIIKSEESLSSLGVVIQQALRRHELERRAQILQQIVENASDSIVTMEMNGEILTANRAVEPMFGYAPEEVVGRPASLLFPDMETDNEAARMLAASAADKPWQGDLSARRKDGSLFPAHLSTSVLRDRGGRALCLIAIVRDVTERRQLLDRLQRLSVTDNLTGLFNHRFFHARLEYEFARARRYNESLGCIMMDVDYFKAVNDTHGHVTGDEVLKSLAQIIPRATRSADIVARYGGEEFAVLLPNTNLAGAVRCAEHIWEAIGTTEINTRQGPVRLTVSVGVTALAPDVKEEAELHRRADAALITAKRRGRNNVCVWEEIPAKLDAPAPSVEGEDADTVCRNLHRLMLPPRARYLEAARSALESLCRREPALWRHSANVTLRAMELGRLAGMTPEEKEALHHAARFHDIGHILTPAEVLAKKPGKLTPEERHLMETHVEASRKLIAELQVLDRELGYVQYHHERYDGKGYPEGLTGDAIPLGARILAIADAYEAMVSGRLYQEAMTEAETLAELERNAGTQFDPKLVSLFLQVRGAQHAGLRDGEDGSRSAPARDLASVSVADAQAGQSETPVGVEGGTESLREDNRRR